MATDIETQQKGVVGIAWVGGDNDDDGNDKPTPEKSLYERVVVRSGRGVEEGIPVRVVALHMCFPDAAFWRLIRAFYVCIVPQEYLPRIKFHFGRSYRYSF